MKNLFLTSILVTTFLVIGCSPTFPLNMTVATTPTTIPPTPQPEAIIMPSPLPNTGNVNGHISYFDGAPASLMEVWFFKQGETSSYKGIWTNNNGDYVLSNAPIGSYKIYTASFRHDSPVSFIQVLTSETLLPPDSTVVITDQQIVTVPTIIVPRQISHIHPNNSSSLDIADPTANISVVSPLTFSWEPIPNAISYSVLFQTLNYQSTDYSNTIVVKEAKITSSILQGYNYQMLILAYDKQGARVGEGHGWFTVSTTVNPTQTPNLPETSSPIPSESTLRKLPTFSIKNLTVAPNMVSADSDVSITATVINDGDYYGSYNVNLKIDGVFKDVYPVNLNRHTYQTVGFTVSEPVAKTYIVSIDDQTANFTVTTNSTLRNPTWKELYSFLVAPHTDSGIRSGSAFVHFYGINTVFRCSVFSTTDYGLVFVDAQRVDGEALIDGVDVDSNNFKSIKLSQVDITRIHDQGWWANVSPFWMFQTGDFATHAISNIEIIW